MLCMMWRMYGYSEHLNLITVSNYDLFFLKALSECGHESEKSIGSDRQEWSYTLYDFEGQGHVTRDVSFFYFNPI